MTNEIFKNNTSKRNEWKPEQALAVFILKSKGVPNDKIAEVVGHSKHSIQYLTSVRCKEMKETEDKVGTFKKIFNLSEDTSEVEDKAQQICNLIK